MKRSSGILLHVSSLKNKYGIGTFGTECYEFIDFLKESGQKFWEVLPLNQTGFGDSPYSSCSVFSFNPYFISPEALAGEGLLHDKELKCFEDGSKYVDYGKLYNTRFRILRLAFSRFDKNDKEFKKFVKKNEYGDYALYMTIKGIFAGKAFYDWAPEYKFRNSDTMEYVKKQYKEEILFWQFLQYEASSEWEMVKGYAKENGISIIGDMPFYPAYDSADVWANPNLFKLDENLFPRKVAGVPPDYFSETGQLWGNPVYDFDVMKSDGYSWWIKRFKYALKTFDYVRLDHFRGFDRYYEIDYGRPDAKIGRWVNVDGEGFFKIVHDNVKKDRIIAEDLGIIDDGVRELLKKCGYPGMRILSFAFNGDEKNFYLPEKIEENSVCFTGTHDNDTLIGLIEHFSEWDKKNFYSGGKNSLGILKIKKTIKTEKDLAEAVIELGFACKAELFIVPLTDAALLTGDYRMNTPGRETGNWTMRIPSSATSKKISSKLKKLCEKYKRN